MASRALVQSIFKLERTRLIVHCALLDNLLQKRAINCALSEEQFITVRTHRYVSERNEGVIEPIDTEPVSPLSSFPTSFIIYPCRLQYGLYLCPFHLILSLLLLLLRLRF